jgi:hypothetical protein
LKCHIDGLAEQLNDEGIVEADREVIEDAMRSAAARKRSTIQDFVNTNITRKCDLEKV